MTRAMIAKIHIAKKEMGLDDASYRNVLKAATGKESSKDLSERELERVLGKFKELGWKPKVAATSQGAYRSSRSAKPNIRLIHELWNGLEIRGAVSAAGLGAFVKRQTGVDNVEWLDTTQANKVIEGLKAWLGRVKRGAKAP